MKNVLLAFFIFTHTLCNAQSWQAVGPDDFKQISYAGASAPNVYLDTLGNAFISYYESGSNAISIKKETSAGWIQVTQVTPSGLYYSLVMDKSGNFYLADDTLATGGYAIRLRKFNGTVWSLAAPVYLVNSNSHPFINMKLDLLDRPTVLYSDTGISVFPKMVQWDGSNWGNIGGTIVNTSFSIPFVFDFDSNNVPFVCHYNALTNDYKVKKFDGTNWNNICSSIFPILDFKIYKDTMYSSTGTDGWIGGLGPHPPSSTLYKYNGTYWSGIGIGINAGPVVPLIASTTIKFDDSGNAYLTGGTIWKIQNGQISAFGATGDLAIKGEDTFYTVDNSEYHNDKLRVVKKNNNVWVEEYPVSINPFLGGRVGTYSFPNYTTYTRQPYHQLFTHTNGDIYLSSPTVNAISNYTNGNWDTSYFNYNSSNYPSPPYTILRSTSNELYFLNTLQPSSFSSNDLILYKLMGQNWFQIGGKINSSSSSYLYGSFVLDKNDTPYVAYVDLTTFGANRVRVKKYDGVTWADISTSMPFASSGGSENPLLTCDTANNISVLYKENNTLYMKKFDGVNWNIIGSAIDTTSNTDYKVKLTEAGIPIVLYLRSFNGQLKPVAKKFDGTNWNTLGLAGFSNGEVTDLGLLSDDDTIYAAYTDISSKKVIVAKFDGLNWGALGSTTISRDSSSHPNLVKSGNDIYISYFSDGLFVKKNTNDTIVPLFQCMSPSVTIAGVTDTSAMASWTIPVQVIGYEYHLSTTNTVPAGNGIFTNSITYPANGLQPNTAYYFFIRTICGIDTSSWSMTSFTTTQTTHVAEAFTGNADIKIYPNPVANVLHIEQVNTVKQHHLELYDLFGRTIRTIRFSAPAIQVDLEGLPSGVYFLRSKGSEKNYSFKVVKQ